jgi:hypothetical protein
LKNVSFKHLEAYIYQNEEKDDILPLIQPTKEFIETIKKLINQ